MKKILLFAIVLCAAGIITARASLIKDFSGTYLAVPDPEREWCGKSITLEKIRFNKYRILWTLGTGYVTDVTLSGRAAGNVLDFKRGAYGYTYTFSDNNRKLVITLRVPREVRECVFFKIE